MTLPLPSLPASGSTSWYTYVQALDAAVNAVPEIARDTIGTALVAGTNVTITPNDAGDSITIASTGGSGSGVTAYVDVMSSGAVGDGVANDTTALQTFINANTGKIIVWPEKTFNVSQLLLPSGTHLELGDAIIRRTSNTNGGGGGATIRNSDQTGGNSNITVRGGTITGGSGTSGRCWSMMNVTNLRAQDVQLEKGAATFSDWMFHFEMCTTVRVDNCRVSGGQAVGEDGLHIKSSQDMVVNNCILEAGDDALVLVHEFNQTRPIKNIAITNCVLASENANALRISVWTGETQPIEDVTLDNIVVRPPLDNVSGGNCMTIGDQTNTGLLRRVNLSNFQVNATGYAGNAINISNVVDSTFTNWRVSGASNRSFHVDNCDRLTFTNVVADTPAVSTGNPQWTITGGCTNLHHIGCEVRNARIWGWTIDGAGTSDITFTGCRSIASAQQAWLISHASRVTIMGCTVNGGASPLSCDTTNPPSQVNIVGNSFSGYSGNVVANAPATLNYASNNDLGNGPTTSTAGSGASTASPTRLALYGFYAALGNRHNAPCDILVIGDSITEGEGASPNANRWIDLFRDRIREDFPTTGVTGGYGFVPGANTISAPAGFTASGNTAGDTAGLGARTRILGASTGSGAGSMSITRTCTKFDIHHVAPNTSSAFTVTIDGGAPTTVTGVAGEQVWSSPTLSDASHTIVITQSSGLAYIEGAFFYRGDETKGVRVWEAGKSGSRVGNFVSGGTFGTTWANSISKVTPDLVVIAFGTNDSAQVSAAQFSSDLTALITLIRSKAANVPIALMPPIPRVGGMLATWASYVASAATVAAATTNCALLSLGDRIPTPSPDTYSILADALHPNNKGHALMADTTLALLAPAGN